MDALATEDPDAAQEEEELQVYEKHNPLLHGSKKAKYGEVSTFSFITVFPALNQTTSFYSAHTEFHVHRCIALKPYFTCLV